MKKIKPYITTLGILIACLAVLLGGVHLIYGDYCRRQIEEEKSSQFTTACLRSDALLTEILNYAGQLSDIQSIYYRSDRGIDEPTLFMLLNNLKSYTDWTAEVAYFWRGNPKYVFTAEGKSRYTDFQQHLTELGVDVYTSTVFSQLLTSSSPALQRASPDGKLIFDLPIGTAWLTYHSTLMLVMEPATLISCFSGQEGDLYAIGRVGTILFTRLNQPDSVPLTLQELYPNSFKPVTEANLKSGKTVLLNQRSETNLLTYTAAIPEREFYADWYSLSAKLDFLIIAAMLACVLTLCVYFFLSYRFWKRAYISMTGFTPSGSQREDLSNLVRSFNETQSRNALLTDRLDSSLNTIRRQLLLSLINSQIKKESEFNLCRESLMMRLDRPWWAALFLPLQRGKNPDDHTDLALVALDNIFVGSADILFAECRWEKGIGIVVNYEGEEPAESLRRIAHSIFDQLQKQLPFSFVLSVGSADDSALNMGISFYRATANIKAQPVPNDSGVCFWRETALEMTAAPDTTLLAEAVTFGNSEVALKAFHDLCQRLGRVNEPYSIIHMMCCDLLNTVIRAAQRQNVTPDPAELKNAAEFSSLQDFEARSEEMIRSICQHASQRRDEDASREHSELISFITRNYKRNDFSLSMLAEEMEMSISKINMLLKEKIGCSFVQYVSLLRINEVKRMLRETDLPIQAIVQEVGYLDMSSFIRKFRRMEGISPGQYRAQYRE